MQLVADEYLIECPLLEQARDHVEGVSNMKQPLVDVRHQNISTISS